MFGSYLVQVDPDRAHITFRVTRTRDVAREAFRLAREAADAVKLTLEPDRRAGADIRSSSMTLRTLTDGYHNGGKFLGHAATISFHATLNDIDAVEGVLTRVIEAGADSVDSVDFHSSKLKEVRARARRGAIVAAHAKAELYADAAGVQVGRVLHIEDVNPMSLGGHGHGEDLRVSYLEENEEESSGPGAITIAAAVNATYAIL
ncbi:MAG: SIMPL domain-containing protein [Myxococcota bacterium]